MIDITKQINDIHREVGTGTIDGAEARTVVLRRRYDATVDDVWDACTNAERIERWFMPVSGDLRLGGTYQLEGNAGGTILHCEQPRLLHVTWVFGAGPPSEVEVRLTPDGDERTLFELTHIAVVPPEMWEQFGPGAVGVGWDLGLLGLGLHLTGGEIDRVKAAAWQESQEAKEFITRSSESWGAAYEKSGASVDTAASAVKQTTAFYTGQAETPPNEN